jgi:hypothetical protein
MLSVAKPWVNGIDEIQACPATRQFERGKLASGACQRRGDLLFPCPSHSSSPWVPYR